MKYECENCGAFYSDEDVTEEGEMREDCYGVRFWATFHYCPCCGEEVITDEDYEDTETIEDINKSLYSEWMRQALQEGEKYGTEIPKTQCRRNRLPGPAD